MIREFHTFYSLFPASDLCKIAVLQTFFALYLILSYLHGYTRKKCTRDTRVF